MRRFVTCLLVLLIAATTVYAQSTPVADPNDILVLVNRDYALGRDFRPDDLVSVGNGHLMRERAADALYRMHRAMSDETGLFLTVRSGFRSYETQRTLFNNAVRNQGLASAQRWIARPGHSEHQTGLAVDILQRGFTGSPLSSARFQTTRQFAWLQQHAHTFGFIMRYPREYEHITGFAFEPWHWRYIGVESATYMRENGFAVFESYIAHRRTRDIPSAWAAEQVRAAIDAGLVPAHLQSRYAQSTTRAEFTALAVTLYETLRGEIAGRVTFTDTDDANVEKAAYIGVVQGVGGGRFAPNDPLTREQAAVMLARLAEAIGQPLPDKPAYFTDLDSISGWALEGVGRAQAAGIMVGFADGTFAPRGPYTREQSIVTVWRMFELVR